MVKRRCGLKHFSFSDLPSEILQIIYSHLAAFTLSCNRVSREKGLISLWNLAFTSNFIFKEFDKFRSARFDLFLSRNNVIVRLPLRCGKRRFYLDEFSNVNGVEDLYRCLKRIKNILMAMKTTEVYFFASNWTEVFMINGGKCHIQVETNTSKLTTKCKCYNCNRFFASGATLSSYGDLFHCCRHFLTRFDEKEDKYVRQIWVGHKVLS